MKQKTRNRGVSPTSEGIEKLQNRRLENNWSYEKLANEAQLSLDTVKRIIAKDKLIDRDSIRKIVKALDLQPIDIVAAEEWEPPLRNLKVKQKSTSVTVPDWKSYCRKILPVGLTSNPLLHMDGMTLSIGDIVPLDLVERKQQPQIKGDLSPEHFQTQSPIECETPITHKQFFEQVLKNGNSPKSHGRKIAILGEPGAGKTTFLQEIANWINCTGELPIFVNLVDLQKKSLEEYLLKDWLKLATQKPRITQDIEDEFVEQFNLGRVWLLLDGVDEIAASGNLLSNLAEQLEGWIAQARIVLSCRLNVWDVGKNALYTFDTYRTLKLTYPELVSKFITNFFCKVGEPIKGEKLIERLDQSPERVRDLVKNPLQLTLLCRTWKRRQREMPQTKAELYKQFVDTFYLWKDKPEIPPGKQQILESALGELAKRAIDEEKTKFRLRKTLIREELDKFDESLFDLACNFGWLNQIGMAAEDPDESVYAFFHPTFQEYFAACAIKDWHYFLNHVPHEPKQRVYRIFEKQWKEVFLLWIDRKDVLKEQKDQLLAELVNFEDKCEDWYWYRAYWLACDGINHDNILHDDLRLGEILDFDEDGAPILRIYEVNQHKKLSLSPLPLGFADDYSQGDYNLCFNFHEENSRKALLEQIDISQSELPFVTGDIQGLNNINTLIEMLAICQNSFTRGEIINKIVEISSGNSTSISTLIRQLNTSQDKKIQLSIIWILWQILPSNLYTVNALTHLLKNNSDKLVRATAAEVLTAIVLQTDLFTKAAVQMVVTNLKICLVNQICNSDFELYRYCQTIIWYCSCKLSYPDFHDAWHNQVS